MWKKHQSKLIAVVVIAAALAAAFYLGGGGPETRGWAVPGGGQDTPGTEQTTAAAETPANNLPTERPVPETTAAPEQAEQVPQPTDETPQAANPTPEGPEDAPDASGMEVAPNTGKDAYMTDPVPEGMPLPVEPEDAAVEETVYTCTVSISCATVLDNLDYLAEDKAELIPEDGWVLEPVEVTFQAGESVFDVLLSTAQAHKIHMEYMDTPMYNSAYIEGIANLYEFDCGSESGWMYSVNGWFPNYGCSRYQLNDGDVVEWVYTCDLGKDVGDNSLAG